jgi:methylmalonyl-CoA mutase
MNDMTVRETSTEQKTDKEITLFDEFAYPTYDEWRKAAEKSLKGGAFEEKLVTKTYEGIDLQPMYTNEDIENLSHISSLPGETPYVRGTETLGYIAQPWEICQELFYRSPEEFNRAARTDVVRGQTMLNLAFDSASLQGWDPDQVKAEEVGKRGTSIISTSDTAKAFAEIDLEKIPVFIHTGAMGLPIFSLLMAHIKQQGQDSKKLRGCIGMDPLGELVKEGKLPCSLKSSYDFMGEILKWTLNYAPSLQTVIVEGHPYHNGGGSAVHELAFALATGVEYLRELQERGLSIDEIAPRICFSLSIGSNFFMEIAKFRAARLLWSNVVREFGGSDTAQKMFIHARTSAWTKTVHDPYVNMLRCTAEAFAGIIGGVNSLHVSSFDEAIRPADNFSRRIARNTQIILQQEAHLSKVVDPAGGSWYIESLTDSLAKKAWEAFQEIEAQGGMFHALKKGLPQEQIAEVAKERSANIGRRKDKFVGTNVYPNLKETPLTFEGVDSATFYRKRISDVAAHRDVFDQVKLQPLLDRFDKTLHSTLEHVVDIAIHAVSCGATIGDLAQVIRQADEEAPTIEAVRMYRATEQFESLRSRAMLHKEKTGSYPQVFLANMEPILQHKSRADFSTGFFEVGGFEVIQNQGFSTVEEAVRAANESKASIVVICSTDETYPDVVPPLVRLIKEANPDTTVLVAGQPATEYTDIYNQAGVDGFIHARVNCYETLLKLQDKKGIGK